MCVWGGGEAALKVKQGYTADLDAERNNRAKFQHRSCIKKAMQACPYMKLYSEEIVRLYSHCCSFLKPRLYRTRLELQSVWNRAALPPSHPPSLRSPHFQFSVAYITGLSADLVSFGLEFGQQLMQQQHLPRGLYQQIQLRPGTACRMLLHCKVLLQSIA